MKKARLFKTVLIALSVVVLLVVAGLVAANIYLTPARVNALVLPHAEKALGRKAEIGGVGVSLFPVLGVRVSNVTVANSSRVGFQSTPMIVLGQARVGVHIIPLLGGKVEISRIILSNVELLIESDSSGSWNYSDLAFMPPPVDSSQPAKKSGGLPVLPVPVTLERFTIDNLKLDYIDRKAGQAIRLGSVSQELALSIDKKLQDIRSRGEITISDIAFSSKEIGEPLEGLQFSLSHQLGLNLVSGHLKLDEMRLGLQKFALQVRGTIDSVLTNPVYDLALVIEKMTLSDLLKDIPVSMVPELAKLNAQGTFELVAQVKGQADSSGIPPYSGEVILGDATIAYTDLPQAINHLSAAIDFTSNSANIKHLKCALGEDPIELQLSVVNFSQPQIDGFLKASVNLGNLKNVIALPQDLGIDGRLVADLKANGLLDPNNPASLDFSGQVALTGISVVTPAVTKPVLMDGTVSFTSAEIVTRLSSRIGRTSLSFSANLSRWLQLVLPDQSQKYGRGMLVFSIDAPLLDADEFLPKATVAGTAESGQAAAPKTGGEAALLLAAPLPGVDVKGNVSSKTVIYSGLQLSSVKGSFENRNDQITVDMSAGIFKGTMRHRLDIDARSHADIQVKSSLQAQGVDIGQFVSDITVFLPQDQPLFTRLKELKNHLSGTARLKNDMTTRGGTSQALTKNLTGTVDSHLENGEIGGKGVEGLIAAARALKVIDLPSNRIPFRTFKIGLEIRDEKVHFSDVTAQSPLVGELAMLGSVGFNAYLDTDIKWRHTSAHSQKLQGAEKGLKSVLEKNLGGQAGALLGAIDVVPADKEGRVTSLWAYNCPMQEMKNPQFKGFAAGDGSGRKAPSAQQQIVNTAKEAVRQEAEKQVDRATQAAKERAADIVNPAQDAVKKEVNDELKNAAKKLKKLF